MDIIWKSYPDLLDQNLTKAWFTNNDKNNAVKPLVLMPPITECCGKSFSIRHTANYAVVFTENGTLIAAVFHGRCPLCCTTYWHSYKETFNGERYYFNPCDETSEFFLYSRDSVFSKKYLQDVTNNITFSGATFLSRAEVYNANHGTSDREKRISLSSIGRSNADWKLSESVVGNAWFLWSIVNKYHEYGVLEKVNIPCTYTDGRHRDIEGLCSECFTFLKAQPNKWIQHVCLYKGCQEGYVTVDGNCKLRRPICAAKGELEEIGPGLPKVFRCCPNTPILGNQSKKANTFCEEHMDDSAVGTPNADGGTP